MLSFGSPVFAEEDCTEKKRFVYQELGLKDSNSNKLLDCNGIRDAFTMLKSPRIPISSWEYEGGFRLTTKGDTLEKYARPPLFLTYKLKATTENAESK